MGARMADAINQDRRPVTVDHGLRISQRLDPLAARLAAEFLRNPMANKTLAQYQYGAL